MSIDNEIKEEKNESSAETYTLASSLIEFLSIVTAYRKFIVRFVVSITFIVTLVAILSPKWYKSTATVFPAEKADMMSGLDGIASFAKSMSAKSLASLGANPELDRYCAILKSGRVIAAVIQKFDLVHVYEITSYPGEKTAKVLMGNVEIKVEDEGYLSISVYDKDPQRAADMANYFVEMLNKTNSEIQVQNALGTRQFIEERYKKNLIDLAKAEDTLKTFETKYGVVALPEQMKASIETSAEFYGELARKEVQLSILKRRQSPDDPSVLTAQIEVDELQNKFTKMNMGTGQNRGGLSVFLPFSKMPELGTEYIRRYRNVEIQYKILQFVTPLYEQAKVEEQRATPSVLILDKASPAERKSKPKVALYGLLALVVSSGVALFFVFVHVGFNKIQSMDPMSCGNIASAFRHDWLGLRWNRRDK
jgi:tyrosine-protein kinase Etk/Wzc